MRKIGWLRVCAAAFALMSWGACGGAAWGGTDGPALTADQAKLRAQRYLGLTDPTDLKGVTMAVRETVPGGDSTPFISRLINGHQCYLVAFANVKMWTPLRDAPRAPRVHDLNVLLDARSGKLLRIWSAERVDETSTLLSAAEIEARFGRNEQWTGLPEDTPKVPLLQLTGGGFEQLDAYYVMSAMLGRGPRPTWQVITGQKGHPYFPLLRPTTWTPDPKEAYFWRTVLGSEFGGGLRQCSLWLAVRPPVVEATTDRAAKETGESQTAR